MKELLLITLLSFATRFSAFSQQVIINGSVGNRALVWDDFTGLPDPSSKYAAVTYYNLSYEYSKVQFKGDTAFIGSFTVKLELNPAKSWRKKGRESAGLLLHEQGHFDLGRLSMLEIIHIVSGTTFYRADYIEKIQSMTTQVLHKYREMNLKYDEETDHFNNKQKQQEWTSYIQQEIMRLTETSMFPREK